MAQSETGQVVDFAQSAVTWLLPEQASYGRFTIDAALTVGASGTRETFYLGAQVFAGNVYGDGDLFRLPPYEFAAAFSDRDFRIFRASHGGDVVRDDFGAHGERFAKVVLDIRRVACRRIEPSLAGLAASRELVGRFSLQAPAGDPAVELEFPVRHVNVNPSRGAFQVETGPVLVLAAGTPGEMAGRLRRAYVNFNRLDRVQFLIDGAGDGKTGRWCDTKWQPCVAELFSCER